MRLLLNLPQGINLHSLALLKAAGSRSFDLLKIDVGNIGVLTIKDLSDFLESGTLGLDVEEADEAELDEDPDLLTVKLAWSLKVVFRERHTA